VDGQVAAVFVIDKAMFPEPIHEMTDPRPGCADHLRQGFLIDSGEHSFGPAVLANMGQQQENPSQTLLAVVEQLVDKVLFKSDLACKQMVDEHFRHAVLFVEHARHDRLGNPHKSAICQRHSRFPAQRLTVEEASLAEEISVVQNGDNRFAALSGCDHELHLASPEVEHRIRRLSLHEDAAVRAVFQSEIPAQDSSEEGFPIDGLATLACRNRCLRHHVARLELDAGSVHQPQADSFVGRRLKDL